MKRMFIVLVALSLIATLGCVKKNPDATGKTVVSVWAHQGQEAEVAAITGIIDAFNKAHPDIYAQLTIIPSGFKHSYETKVTSAKLSGKLPDVLDLDGPFVAQYAWSGILQPVDDLVTTETRGDFLPSIIEQGTFKGKLYALGAFESGMGLYYNKKLISEAGIEIPANPDQAWTWEEFLAALDKAKKLGVIPLSLDMGTGPSEWFTYAFTPLVWTNGQKRLIAQDGTTTAGYVNSATAADALQKFQNLFTANLSSATPPPDLFVQGKAAFMWVGHWMMDKFEASPDLDWGLLPLPYMKERMVPSGSWCWGITTQSKNRGAAFEVLSWIVGSETGIVPMVKANNAPPARKSALALLPSYQTYPRKLFIDGLQRYAHPRPITPSYGIFSDKFADAVHNIALGKDPQKQLDKASKAIDVVLVQQAKIKK